MFEENVYLRFVGTKGRWGANQQHRRRGVRPAQQRGAGVYIYTAWKTTHGGVLFADTRTSWRCLC